MKHSGDTGWQPIIPVSANDERAAGRIEMVHGNEVKPCFTCRSWEKDQRRIIEHFLAHGLEARPDGKFVTPIAKDFPGRKSMVLDPKTMGFCRLWAYTTEDLATCERYVPLERVHEMAARTKR